MFPSVLIFKIERFQVVFQGTHFYRERMKKILMTALVPGGASLFTASAASKKKVKKAATLLSWKSSADSLSYVKLVWTPMVRFLISSEEFYVGRRTAYMENSRGKQGCACHGNVQSQDRSLFCAGACEVAKLVEKRAYPGRLKWRAEAVQGDSTYQPCYVP